MFTKGIVGLPMSFWDGQWVFIEHYDMLLVVSYGGLCFTSSTFLNDLLI